MCIQRLVKRLTNTSSNDELSERLLSDLSYKLRSDKSSFSELYNSILNFSGSISFKKRFLLMQVLHYYMSHSATFRKVFFSNFFFELLDKLFYEKSMMKDYSYRRRFYNIFQQGIRIWKDMFVKIYPQTMHILERYRRDELSLNHVEMFKRKRTSFRVIDFERKYLVHLYEAEQLHNLLVCTFSNLEPDSKNFLFETLVTYFPFLNSAKIEANEIINNCSEILEGTSYLDLINNYKQRIDILLNYKPSEPNTDEMEFEEVSEIDLDF